MSNRKHFVTFLSPGTLFNESTTQEIVYLDVKDATNMAGSVRERYGTRPYAFYFTTKELQGSDWGLKQVEVFRSPMYFIRGEKLSLNDIIFRCDSKDDILISNMKNNGWDYVVNVDGQHFPVSKNDVFV